MQGDGMKSKAFIFCGMLASAVYVCTVSAGGFLWPGYSHISQFVSDLIGSGAPNKWLLDPLFGLYNLLCLAFGWGVFIRARADSGNRRKTLGSVGAIVLLFEGLFGFLTLFFPEDPAGAQITKIGMMHIVLAGLSSLATMVSMLMLGLWFRTSSKMKPYGIYSVASLVVVFVFGGLAAALGASHHPLIGLIERITIGGFLQWMFVSALRLQSSGRKSTA
jgi:hypothetical protein